jgi:hypothetical protein
VLPPGLPVSVVIPVPANDESEGVVAAAPTITVADARLETSSIE